MCGFEILSQFFEARHLHSKVSVTALCSSHTPPVLAGLEHVSKRSFIWFRVISVFKSWHRILVCEMNPAQENTEASTGVVRFLQKLNDYTQKTFSYPVRVFFGGDTNVFGISGCDSCNATCCRS